MCHADGSLPPRAPGAGAVAQARDIHLTSADGTSYMAYEAMPEQARGQGVVILPDFRGLHEFYKALARRLAEAGLAAVAIDYFGRDLPDGPRDAPAEATFPLLMKLTPEIVAADVRAASDYLRAGQLGPVADVFSLGFCFGGSQSWLQSAFDETLAGCIGFYGRPDDCRGHLDDMRVPLLMLVAGADAMTPVEDFERFDAELSEAGVEHRMVVYEGAPHSFFDGGGDHAEACADAWRQLLDFVERRTVAVE